MKWNTKSVYSMILLPRSRKWKINTWLYKSEKWLPMDNGSGLGEKKKKKSLSGSGYMGVTTVHHL